MACSNQLTTEIRNLILEEVGQGDYNLPYAFTLFRELADRAWIVAKNPKELQSDDEARAIIKEFHLYKKEMTEIETAPITTEEIKQWT